MIERPNVDAMMAGELGQWLQTQAGVRDEAREKSNMRFVWAAVIALPVLGFLWFTPISEMFKFFLTAACLMFGSYWGYLPRAKAIKDTKTGINSALAQALQITYSHDCNPSHGFERAVRHKMIDGFTRSSFEDLWSGELGGSHFILHEAHLERKEGSGKNSRWVTVFQGPIITITCNREFHGVTLVERSGRHKKFLFFGEADDITLEGVALSRADMVHPDFEDAFTVFTSDQVESRYLVHPTYIERLIELENAFSGKNIRTVFKDRELTIVLSTKNMFESGSMNASRDREMVEKCVSQFMAMAELASALNEEAR